MDWLDVDKGFSARAFDSSDSYVFGCFYFLVVARHSWQDLLQVRCLVTSAVLIGLGLRLRLPSSILVGDSSFSGPSESCSFLDWYLLERYAKRSISWKSVPETAIGLIILYWSLTFAILNGDPNVHCHSQVV